MTTKAIEHGVSRVLPFLCVVIAALFPVIGLAAANADELSAQQVFRSLTVAVGTGLTLLILLRLLLRDWGEAALIATAILLLFFSYGHLYQMFKGEALFGLVVGRHRYLLLVMLGGLAIWNWIVLKVLTDVGGVLTILTIVGAALLIYPLISIAGRELEILNASASPEPMEVLAAEPLSTGGRDIYYIVLDGYGRQDVLSRIYDLDNTEFIDFLEQSGFYVAKDSRSNYIQTALSLASSLNLEYVNDLADILGEKSTNRGPLNARIHDNFAMDFLNSRGYQLLAFNTGLEATSIEDVDIYLPSEDNPYFRRSLPETWLLNPFEGLLIETTAVSALFDVVTQFRGSYLSAVADPLYEVHRERVNYTLESLGDVPGIPGDVFVFAHVVAPHPPFVFGADGEPVNPDRPYGLFDGTDFISAGGTMEEYIAGYRDEVVYLNTKLTDSIAKILSRSHTPPIIIIQSDHGPGAHLIWASPGESDIEERISILNAYYLPEGGTDSLYPSISPVNSFRIVFNHYFGQDFKLLDDVGYFSSSVSPYDFMLLED